MRFPSGSIVAAGGEVVGAFLGFEGVDQPADGVPETFDGPLGGFSQESFKFGEHLFDGIEVGAVGRQEEEARAGRRPPADQPAARAGRSDVGNAIDETRVARAREQIDSPTRDLIERNLRGI